MIELGLTSDEELELWELLHSSYELRIDLTMMDLDHNFLGSISNHFLSGTVEIDADADITRTAKLKLSDAGNTLNLDKDSPSEIGVYLDRMIQIHYCVRRVNGRWFEIPVFTGPVADVTRDGITLDVELHGKEVLAKDPPWKGATFGANWRRVALIRRLLRDVGETHFKFANIPGRVGEPTNIDRDKDRWSAARRLASEDAHQLFYDALGRARLRENSNVPACTLTDHSLVEPLKPGFSLDGVTNAVEVRGSAPKGRGRRKQKAKRVWARAVAGREEPLSPWSIGRTTAPRFLPLFLERTAIKSTKQAKRVARNLLRRGMRESIEVETQIRTIPMLQERDVLKFETSKFNGTASLKKATIPLSSDARMSIGYIKTVRPSKLSRNYKRAA